VGGFWARPRQSAERDEAAVAQLKIVRNTVLSIAVSDLDAHAVLDVDRTCAVGLL
jgi:hypothetical protein